MAEPVEEVAGGEIHQPATNAANDVAVPYYMPGRPWHHKPPRTWGESFNQKKYTFLIIFFVGAVIHMLVQMYEAAMKPHRVHLAAHSGDHHKIGEMLYYAEDRHALMMERHNKSGRTPLMNACHQGHVSVLKVLLTRPYPIKGSNVTLIEDDGQLRKIFEQSGGLKYHPLMKGMLGKRFTVLNVRLEDEMIALPSPDGSSGGRWHFPEEAMTLIEPHDAQEKRKEMLLAQAEYGMTALHYAAHEGHVQVTRELLAHADDHIEDVNFQVDQDGWTGLHYASYHGHTPIIKILLKNTMKRQELVMLKDYDLGETPLHRAAGQGKHLAIRTLLEAKDVDANALFMSQDKKGQTAMHVAVKENHRQAAKMLRELAGSDAVLDIKDNEGKIPTDYATGSTKSLLDEHGNEL